MKPLLLILMTVFLCRCASMERSINLGAGIGAASGIAVSRLADYNAKGTVVLGLGGAIIGGVIAAILHRDPPASTFTNGEMCNQPPFADAERDVILVPDTIQGEQFVEKHKIWTIKKPARWQHHSDTEEHEEENTDE